MLDISKEETMIAFDSNDDVIYNNTASSNR
jgi:hypothetical protein